MLPQRHYKALVSTRFASCKRDFTTACFRQDALYRFDQMTSGIASRNAGFRHSARLIAADKIRLTHIPPSKQEAN